LASSLHLRVAERQNKNQTKKEKTMNKKAKTTNKSRSLRKRSQTAVALIAAFTLMVFSPGGTFADSASTFSNYSPGARDVSLGTGESLPYNSTGLFHNPASNHGVSGIEYSERFVPMGDENNYIHTLAIMYSHGRITEFIGARVGFNAVAKEKRYFDFDIPKHHYRMGVIGVAVAPVKQLSIGITGNVYQDKLEDNNSVAFSSNVGLQMRLNLLTLSACAKNYTSYQKENESDAQIELAKAYNGGAYLSLLSGIINFCGQAELNGSFDIQKYSFGTEFTFGKFLSARAGYENSELVFDDSDTGAYSLGAGIKLGHLAADYAIKENPEVENDYIHFITFGINGIAPLKAN